MTNPKTYIAVFIIPLVLAGSCLHSRTGVSSLARNASIKIAAGMANVKIYGQVNQDLYAGSVFRPPQNDEKYYDNPVVKEMTITKNETKAMAAGDEYRFSILPTEVVTLNIVSLDGNDVEILISQYGKETKQTVKGGNMLGFNIAFQN